MAKCVKSEPFSLFSPLLNSKFDNLDIQKTHGCSINLGLSIESEIIGEEGLFSDLPLYECTATASTITVDVLCVSLSLAKSFPEKMIEQIRSLHQLKMTHRFRLFEQNLRILVSSSKLMSNIGLTNRPKDASDGHTDTYLPSIADLKTPGRNIGVKTVLRQYNTSIKIIQSINQKKSQIKPESDLEFFVQDNNITKSVRRKSLNVKYKSRQRTMQILNDLSTRRTELDIFKRIKSNNDFLHLRSIQM